ncbi:MAG: hypothetical protein J7L82_04580 [Staphylothermus sp.]|nr:hypothetical protein [Staphylothermus sp.]
MVVKNIVYDPLLSIMGITRDDLYEVVGLSITSGEPYIRLCGECRGKTICLLLEVAPLADMEYRVLLSGILIIYGHDKVIDKEVETVMRFAKVIKSVSRKASFYIPRIISDRAYRIVCGDTGLSNKKFEAVPVEEVLVYMD